MLCRKASGVVSIELFGWLVCKQLTCFLLNQENTIPILETVWYDLMEEYLGFAQKLIPIQFAKCPVF